jgi:hypothetical protein
MNVRGIPAALLLGAMPAVAQGQPAPPPPVAASSQEAALRDAAAAFGQCVSSGIRGVAATVTPEAGTAGILAGCSAQRDQLAQAAEALIATLPAEQQAAAREHARTGLAQAETQIADAIRQQRAEATAPAQ